MILHFARALPHPMSQNSVLRVHKSSIFIILSSEPMKYLISVMHSSLTSRIYQTSEIVTFRLIKIMLSIKTDQLHIVFESTFIRVSNLSLNFETPLRVLETLTITLITIGIMSTLFRITSIVRFTEGIITSVLAV